MANLADKIDEVLGKIDEATAIPIPKCIQPLFGTTPDEDGNSSYPSHISLIGNLYFSNDTESTNE